MAETGNDDFIKFDPEGITSDLNSLEAQYEAYYTAIQNMDMEVATVLQVGDDSALYGTRAGKLLENWTTYCNPYKSFYNTLRSFSSVIIAAGERYNEFQATFQPEGAEAKTIGEITRNIDPSKDMSFEDARKLAALAAGKTEVDGKPILDPRGKGKVTINGETYTVETDGNGNVTKITDSKGGEVYTKQDPADAQVLKNWENMKGNATAWNEYKKSLTPEQQAIAAALESGAKVVSADDAKAAAEEAARSKAENPYAITPEPTPENATDDQLRETGKKNYERAQEVQQQVGEDMERVDNAYVYYVNDVRPELYARAEAGDQEAAETIAKWDQKFEDCNKAYSDAYWGLDKDNTNSIVDGDMVDISTWQSRDGWDGAYERQQQAIADTNEATSKLNGDEVLNEFYNEFLD